MTEELKNLLEEKVAQYNVPAFVANDPLSIPRRFTAKEDVEIAAFLTATISWGNRKAILKSADKMMGFLENNPADFVRNFKAKDLDFIRTQTIHRTFSGEDLAEFLLALQRIYSGGNSLENMMLPAENETDYYHSLHRFRQIFTAEISPRTLKHISSTYKNSPAKRLMMFLRWMVRRDAAQVDLGIWQKHSPAKLSVPLDVHSGRMAREYGLLSRSRNDWKAVAELDSALRKFDPKDPAKYDFALFGMGVNKDFS